MSREQNRAENSRLTTEQIDALRPRIAQLKLIFVALLTGVVLFAVAAVLLGGPLQIEMPPSMISLVLIVTSVVTGFQGLAAPPIIRSTASRNLAADTTPEGLVGVWTSSAVVGYALLESSAFLNLVGVFMTANVVHVVVAGLFTALMFLQYPGTNRVLDWIDRTLCPR